MPSAAVTAEAFGIEGFMLGSHMKRTGTIAANVSTNSSSVLPLGTLFLSYLSMLLSRRFKPTVKRAESTVLLILNYAKQASKTTLICISVSEALQPSVEASK